MSLIDELKKLPDIWGTNWDLDVKIMKSQKHIPSESVIQLIEKCKNEIIKEIGNQLSFGKESCRVIDIINKKFGGGNGID